MPTELTVVNPFAPAVRRLAVRVHVALVCRGWRGSTNNNTTNQYQHTRTLLKARRP